MFVINRLSEILKDVGQEKYVAQKIVIVIISQCFHVKVSPIYLRPFAIFIWQGFLVKCIVKVLDRRELGFHKFL